MIVSKSFVPGVGYKAAKDLTKGERSVVRVSARYKELHNAQNHGLRIPGYRNEGPGGDYQNYRDHHEGLRREALGSRKISPLAANKRGTVNLVPYAKHEMPPGAGAFAFQLGGRKGERYIAMADDAPRMLVQHEGAHVAPKRSGYRLWQIVNDKNKILREEARADMAAGSDYKTYNDKRVLGEHPDPTHSGYAQAAVDPGAAFSQRLSNTLQGGTKGKFDSESMASYRKTQDKIRAAGGPGRATPRQGTYRRLTTDHVIRAGGAAGLAAGGVYGGRKYMRDRNGKFASSGVAKSFTPWEGVRAEVSKAIAELR